MRFIPPCFPSLRTEPPLGTDWCHEVKFDGYRVQIHKSAGAVTVYWRRFDFTKRAGPAVDAVRALECVSCILDGELVGDGPDGLSFEGLHLRRSRSLSVVVFDQLELDGADLRGVPLHARQQALHRRSRAVGSIADI